ncbi:MAG TPA: acyl-CoA thioesterase [Casimicrobiaceae bacterium]|jgi:4-hydroxybenzoyl-CoA thioesterase
MSAVGPRRHVTRFRVEFGDCDPAQIVFYPNFFRWMDAASLQFFAACGMPGWRDLTQSDGIIGTPIVDVSAKFLRAATYGDTIDVETSIIEWRNKSFVMQHVIRRSDDVLVEGREIRVFAQRHSEDPNRIQAVRLPDRLRKLVE